MPSHRRKNPRPTRRHALITLFALACVLVVSRSPWSDAPRAESDRAAISRSGVLGGANYITAAICKMTNNQPASVCAAPSITAVAGGL